MNLMKISGYNKLLNFESDQKSIKNDSNNMFGDLLTNAINQVNEMQIESDELKNQLVIGELDNLHDLTIATEKANIALQVTMSVRNKVVEAYKEIMRIQI